MSKASIIREIVRHGYTAKSPNTLRRWKLEQLEALLASLPALEQAPCVPVTSEMSAYVDAVSYVPSDRELYAVALAKPVTMHEYHPPVQSGFGRLIACCFGFVLGMLRFAGIA